VVAHVQQHKQKRLARTLSSESFNRYHAMEGGLVQNLAILGGLCFSPKGTIAKVRNCSTHIHDVSPDFC
jgi:hypothetical protein